MLELRTVVRLGTLINDKINLLISWVIPRVNKCTFVDFGESTLVPWLWLILYGKKPLKSQLDVYFYTNARVLNYDQDYYFLKKLHFIHTAIIIYGISQGSATFLSERVNFSKKFQNHEVTNLFLDLIQILRL